VEFGNEPEEGDHPGLLRAVLFRRRGFLARELEHLAAVAGGKTGERDWGAACPAPDQSENALIMTRMAAASAADLSLVVMRSPRFVLQIRMEPLLCSLQWISRVSRKTTSG
jgi:hypothetical protein